MAAPEMSGWVPMRTVAEVRRELGVGAPREKNSLYPKAIQRAPRNFNPLKIPRQLQVALAAPTSLSHSRGSPNPWDCASQYITCAQVHFQDSSLKDAYSGRHLSGSCWIRDIVLYSSSAIGVLSVHNHAQAALPYKSKPKVSGPQKRPTLEQRRAVGLEPAERRAVSLVHQLNALRNEKAVKRREKQARQRQVRRLHCSLPQSCRIPVTSSIQPTLALIPMNSMLRGMKALDECQKQAAAGADGLYSSAAAPKIDSCAVSVNSMHI